MAKKVTRRPLPSPNPLEALLDDLQDRAMDFVFDLLDVSKERLKAQVRQMGSIPPTQPRRPPQGRRTAPQTPSKPRPPVRTAYMVLGVTPDAELEVMAAVYRSLSRKYHPDTHPGDKKAEERMLELNAAWEILKDPKKKEEYDRALRKAGL